MLCAGMCSVQGVFIFGDLKDIHVGWNLNGGFWNDLFYSILAIGVPEELVKIIPDSSIFQIRQHTDDNNGKNPD